MPNLTIDLIPGGKRSLSLRNPVMTASGTFGNGLEYARIFDIQRLGAIVSKAITRKPRKGNVQPRIAETAAGMINSIGLQNIGIDAILIPPVPGALSALGAARADIEGDLVQPVYERLHSVAADALVQRFRSLQEQARLWSAEQTARLPVPEVRIEYAADMRYEGQGYDVTVPFETNWLERGDVDAIAAAFHTAHHDVYGHANEQAEVAQGTRQAGA